MGREASVHRHTHSAANVAYNHTRTVKDTILLVGQMAITQKIDWVEEKKK